MALQEEFKTQGDFLFKYRSYFPMIILVVGVIVYWHTLTNADQIQDESLSAIYKWICLGVCTLGLLIRIITVGHTPNFSSGRNTHEGQRASELNQTGIYSLVRHPLYLGNFFMWLGVAMLTQNFWFIIAFVLFFYVYYERIMYAEEAFLRGKFKEEYENWASGVPAFIPMIGKLASPDYGFSWRKAIRQEKNGFAAMFLLFWVFNVIEMSMAAGKFVLEPNFWFYAAIISSVLYLILKILKNMKLLEDKDRVNY